MIPQALVLLLGPAVFVGLLFTSISEIYITSVAIILALMIFLAVPGSILFHFQGYLMPGISTQAKAFLLMLLLQLLFGVYGGLFYHSRQQLILESPTWAKILLILWILVLLIVCVGLLLYFRQQFMSIYRVEVDSGVESVLLPFKTTVSLPKDVKVTWTNDSGRIVHMDQRCSCNSIRLEEQYRLYRNRTEMKKRFNLGDFSLILKNPTDRDSDTYTCSITNSSGNVLIKKQVLLNVKAGPDSLIISIDFGSGFSGYAFNVKPRQEGGETQIKRWSDGLGLDTPKTPTCILFDEHEEFMKFGYEAKTAFNNMREEEAEKHYFLERFKTTVLSRDLSKQTVKVSNNKSMTTLKVFTEVLRFLKDDALKTIKDPEGGEFTASDFIWVLTVPELLKDFTKELIVKSAVQAGLVTDATKDKLMFVLESEAALTWCLKLQPDGFITQNHSRDSQDQPAGAAEPGTSWNDPAGGQEVVQFTVEPEETKVLLETQRDGKRYLVVDCGDYSHFTVHDVLKGGALKTLHEAPKNDLGGQTGERKFKEFLREIFCDGIWDEYEQNFPSEVKNIMFDFSRLKLLDEDVQISCPLGD
ncbi:heat shock 70 kDa protein 12A-like [Poecilia formosa]|uniref:heat shock 70 kDa protein 12A-like n=1 Tax=Poecilia formosa TaxID=48698 RepID=UPI000444222F|nr:PREDICTED: heat shock 70 kDa protein 12A-like [Poecilia formosa]